MAEEKVIIELNIKTDKALADTVALKESVAKLTEELKKTKEAEGETSAAYVKKQAELKATQKELNQTQNILVGLTSAEKDQTVTVEKLGAKNAELRKERDKTNISTKEGQDRIKEINAQIDKNNELIVANSDKLKQQKLNVGNYTDSVKDALKQTGIWGGQSEQVLTKVQGGWDKIKSAGSSISNLFKGSKKDIQDTTTAAGGLAPTMVAGETATVGATGAMKLLKVAIASTGIGLLLVAISSMVAWFAKSAEGIKMVKIATAGLNAIFEAWMGTIIKVGGLYKDLFTGNWGKLKDDVAGIADEWKNIGANIKGAISVAEKEMQLVKDKRKALVDEAEINRDIAKARLDASDKTKTHNERIESLKKSLEGEKSLADEKINLAQKELDIVNEKIRVEEAHGKKASSDLKQQQAELKAAQINAEAEEFQRSKRAMSQLTTLQNDLRKEDEEKQKAAIDRRWKNELGQAEAAVLKEKEFTQARLDAQLKLIDKKRDYELSKENLTKGEMLVINAKFDIERKKAIEDFQKYQIEANKKLAEDQLKTLELELRQYLATNQSKLDGQNAYNDESVSIERARLKAIYDEQQSALQIQKDAGLISQKEFEVLSLEAKNNYENQNNDLENAYNEDRKAKQLAEYQYQFDLDQEMLNQTMFGEFEAKFRGLEEQKRLELEFANKTILTADAREKAVAKINDKYAKADKAIKLAKFQAEVSLAGDFAKNIAQIAGENTKVGKAASVAATTISTIQGSVAAFTGMTSSIPGPVGIGLGIAAAAAALASGYKSVEQILKVNSGLPGDGAPSVGGQGATPPSISAVTPQLPQSVNPSLGQGIISRQVDSNSSASMKMAFSEALSENPLQPTLVTNEVTLNQSAQMQQSKTQNI